MRSLRSGFHRAAEVTRLQGLREGQLALGQSRVNFINSSHRRTTDPYTIYSPSFDLAPSRVRVVIVPR